MEIVFTAAATRQWLDLSADVRRRLDAKLARAGSRLRVGDWRIIFDVEGNTIVVVAVGHRREIYD